ncbi:MAG: ATP-binding protein [Bilophila wadsworthia]
MKEYRNIIEIDRERCNGCGQCVLDCAEGAIAIIDGKATVVSDGYCVARRVPDARRTPAIVRRKPAVRRRQPCAYRQAGRAQAAAFSRSASTSRTERSVAVLRGHRAGIAHGSGESKAAGRLVKKADMARQAAPCTAVRPVPQGADIPCADCSAPASARFCEIASGRSC